MIGVAFRGLGMARAVFMVMRRGFVARHLNNIDCSGFMALVMTVRGLPMAVLVGMLVNQRTLRTWRLGSAFLGRPR